MVSDNTAPKNTFPRLTGIESIRSNVPSFLLIENITALVTEDMPIVYTTIPGNSTSKVVNPFIM